MVYNPIISTPPWMMRGLDLFVCQSLDILLLAVLLVPKFKVLPWICWSVGGGEPYQQLTIGFKQKQIVCRFFCLKEQLLLCVSRVLPRVPKNWLFWREGGRLWWIQQVTQNQGYQNIHFKGRYFSQWPDFSQRLLGSWIWFNYTFTVLGMFKIHFNWDSFCRSGIWGGGQDGTEKHEPFH